MDQKIIIYLLIVISFTGLTIIGAKECSTSLCGPIISKCQLIDACRCEAQLNFTCHEACSYCLGDLFSDCCSCVGICPKGMENEAESHVKVLNQTNADLFDIFVADEDLSGRWVVHREPILTANSSTPSNCTMAFLSSCVEQSKCESSCISMGASGYRWFQTGCCECVGYYCSDFGVNQMRCLNCPESEQIIDDL